MDKIISSKRQVLLKLSGLTSGLLLPTLMIEPVEASTNERPDIEQPSASSDRVFIKRAFEMRDEAVRQGDQGYGAVIVRDGVIVGQSPSYVIIHQDPTAHAEIEAIRDAAYRTGSRDLSGCTLYSSSHACPMCEAAAYWANIQRMVYGASVSDGGRPSLC